MPIILHRAFAKDVLKFLVWCFILDRIHLVYGPVTVTPLIRLIILAACLTGAFGGTLTSTCIEFELSGGMKVNPKIVLFPYRLQSPLSIGVSITNKENLILFSKTSGCYTPWKNLPVVNATVVTTTTTAITSVVFRVVFVISGVKSLLTNRNNLNRVINLLLKKH